MQTLQKTNMDLDSVTQNNLIMHGFAEPLPSLRFPRNSVDSTATFMEYSDSISMDFQKTVEI